MLVCMTYIIIKLDYTYLIVLNMKFGYTRKNSLTIGTFLKRDNEGLLYYYIYTRLNTGHCWSNEFLI